GIIENFEALKAPLIASGHKFTSETDTEVAVHLLEEELTHGRTLDEAALAVLPRLEGAAALAFISAKDPGKIVAARISNAGGVLVGYGDGENFLASDAHAILEHTRRVSFLDHGEVAIITKDAVTFRAITGEKIDKKIETITWDPIAAAKSGYKHFLLKEISEQPRAISDTLLGRVERSSGRVVFDDNVKMGDAFVRAIPRISFVACGTGAYAAMLVELYLFAIYLGPRRGTIDADRSRKLLAEAFHLPTLVDAVLREEPKVRALAYRYHAARNFLFLGRGVNYPTALEGALKLKELSYIHAEGTAAGEMKHGTNALIDEDLPVVAIALKDSVYKKI